MASSTPERLNRRCAAIAYGAIRGSLIIPAAAAAEAAFRLSMIADVLVVVLAGAGYLFDSIGTLASSGFEATLGWVVLLTIIPEVTWAFYLLIKGIRVPKAA